ncbi:MAG TPA: hypothetical protein VF746_32390 [Longimicrobium sp.]|jgi:hypothetical protein
MSDQDEAGGGSPGPVLPGDDFVARLVGDPADPPRTRLLSGYLGASNEEGHTRIYFDAELSGYADVPNDDILHTEPSGGEGPLARTLVWIRADAQALHGPAGGTRQRAGFFEGPVWDQNVGDTVAARGGVAPGAFAIPRSEECSLSCPSLFCPTKPNCWQIWGFTPVVNPTPGLRVNPPAARRGVEGSDTVAAGGGMGSDTVNADTVAFGAAGAAGAASLAFPCGPSAIVCPRPSVVRPCGPSVLVRCPSGIVPCVPSVARPCIPSIAVRCPPSAVIRCPASAVDACPTRFCPPGGFQEQFRGVQGSGGGADTVVYGSGGGSDTVFYGSGGGADTVYYGSGGGADTVYYGSGGGTDTVYYGSGGGADTVYYGSGGGADTVYYGSGGGTDTVYYGSGGGTDTVYYGSGGGTDTVYYGSGGGTDTVYYGSGAGTGPGILPTEWCPSAGLPCPTPPVTPWCPPSVVRCPRTPRCPPTPWCPPSVVVRCPPSLRCPTYLGCEGPTASYACPTVFR